MKRSFVWLLAALMVTIVAGAFLLVRNQRGPAAASSAPVASAYQASDPSRLAETGRPRLVEFFHHA